MQTKPPVLRQLFSGAAGGEDMILHSSGIWRLSKRGQAGWRSKSAILKSWRGASRPDPGLWHVVVSRMVAHHEQTVLKTKKRGYLVLPRVIPNWDKKGAAELEALTVRVSQSEELLEGVAERLLKVQAGQTQAMYIVLMRISSIRSKMEGMYSKFE